MPGTPLPPTVPPPPPPAGPPSAPAASGAVQTTVTIGSGASAQVFDSAARASAGWEAIGELTIHLDGQHDELIWSLQGVGPDPPIALGLPVTLAVAIGGGTPSVKFSGLIVDLVMGPSEWGWEISFRALGPTYAADLVAITADDGTGTAVYNRSPTEGPLYVASDAGLSVGAILARILTIPANATALSGYGIGAYTTLTPPTLPATTVTELGALTMVPPSRVTIGGVGLFNQLQALVAQFHPKYALNIDPDGTVRCRDAFALPSRALVIPGEASGQNPDPVSWPHATLDASECYGAILFTGQDVRAAFLAQSLGTITPAWSSADQSAWTIDDFRQPKDSADKGAVSSLTGNSCTVTSDSGSTHWPADFWDAAGREGVITLMYPAGTGISFQISRPITSCTALAAGGSATITWDAAAPIDSLSYTRYQILGRASPKADVGRLFNITDPTTGATGTSTYVGSHLEAAFPSPVAFSNGSTAFLTSTAVGWVLWSSGGSAPYLSQQVTFEVIPSTGQIRTTEPVVMPFGPASALAAGYPASASQGLPADVQFLVPYNRGDLTVRSPASGYSGTGYTAYGLQRTKVIPLGEDFQIAGQTSQLQVFADQMQQVYRDVVVSGSIEYRGFPTAFDPLAIGYALTLSVPGATTPVDGLSLPVRQVSLRWPQGAGYQHGLTFSYSTERRPLAAGEAIYAHPLGAHGGGTQEGPLPFGASGIPGAVGLPSGWAPRASAAPELDPSSLGMPPEVSRPPTSAVPSRSAADVMPPRSAAEAMPRSTPPASRLPGVAARAPSAPATPFVPGPDAAADDAADRGLSDSDWLDAHAGDIADAPPPPPRSTLAERRGVRPRGDNPGDST